MDEVENAAFFLHWRLDYGNYRCRERIVLNSNFVSIRARYLLKITIVAGLYFSRDVI